MTKYNKYMNPNNIDDIYIFNNNKFNKLKWYHIYLLLVYREYIYIYNIGVSHYITKESLYNLYNKKLQHEQYDKLDNSNTMTKPNLLHIFNKHHIHSDLKNKKYKLTINKCFFYYFDIFIEFKDIYFNNNTNDNIRKIHYYCIKYHSDLDDNIKNDLRYYDDWNFEKIK